MPPDPTPKVSASRKRSTTSKRGAIACVRCKERKAKCVPAPPGTSNVPTCTNCHQARAVCVYLDRTPNELFLLEYVSQLENRVATLELELAKYKPDSIYVGDHSQTQAAAIKSLTQQYPPGDWSLAGPSGTSGNTVVNSGGEENTSPPAAVKEEQGDEDEGNDDLAYGLGRLTLSGSGEPVYVGASSGVNWARVCATALRGPRANNEEGGSSLSRFNYLAPPESSSIESALSYSQHHPIPPLPSPPLAARYLEAAYQHIQARYAFLDWPTIRNWHENREAIVNRPLWGAGRGKDFRRSMAAFNLWLLYGYGARLTEDEHLEGAVSHEVYHNIAVACLSNVANHTSIATVQAELLLTIYSFRHPQPEISVWQTAGLAIRTAIQVGLHRKARSKAERERNPVAYEIKKRTFWTLYTIDRMLALQLGRPSSIQDRDIDVEMPLNIDVEYADAQVIFDMQTKQIEATKGQVQGDEYAKGYDTITSMTSSIHNTRLNRLKQLIQDAIYRLDHPLETRTDRSASHAIPEVDDLLSRLQAWKDASPTLPPGRSGVPLLSRPQQDMEYHNCVQMLLRPVISSRMGIDRYLSQCFDSAASLCEVQWTALNSPSTYRLSNWALYRLFLSGLTLLHLASSPTTATRVDLSRAQRALQRCKDSLGVYVRHLPAMKGYEDVFVELVSGWEAKVTARSSVGHSQQQVNNMSTSPMNKVSPTQSHRMQTAGSIDTGEISNPLRWLESVSNSNQPQPALHIPLQPALPSQVGIHYGPQSTYTNPGGMANTSYTQFSHSQPTLAQAANNMPTLNSYGVSIGQTNQNQLPSTLQRDANQSINENNPYLNATGGNLLFKPNSGDSTLGLGTSASTSAGGSNLDLPSYSFPALEQLAAAPGASVRDDFFSLLSSLGVDMDETLGTSLPPIAEDHLWTSDWGMQATPAPVASSAAQGQNHTINPYLVSPQNSQNGQHQQQQQQQQQQGQAPTQQQYAGEFGWMGDWQSPQAGLGMNVDDSDGSWTFPFM